VKLDRLALHGFSPAFPGVVDLPLRDVAPGLIALTGANGQGKTTLLEATPGLLFRRMPSSDGGDPVGYATGRDSSLEAEFTIDGVGAFRARLSLDGPKRKSDAVLEAIQSDGTRTPLNDGKVSTYDALIATRFPSFDLFINSSFAAQGRGDEFTRRKPSQRKDLFAEFLGLQHYTRMAAQAGDAADLCADARLRLQVRVEGLERDTAAGILAELERQADALQQQGGDAETRQRTLRATIAELEDRAATLADQVAAYAAARQRVQTLEVELGARRAELTASQAARAKAQTAAQADVAAVASRRDASLQDLRNRLHNNENIQSQAAAIRAAVAAMATIDRQLLEAREAERAAQGERDRLTTAFQAADAAVHAYTGPKKDLGRATTDAALLGTVPCHGEGPYAGCSFLVNATAAAGRIADLERHVAGLTDAVTRRDALVAAGVTVKDRLLATRATLTRLAADRRTHEPTAEYEAKLVEAEARIAELQTKRTDVTADAASQTEAAEARRHARLLEFDAQDLALQDAITRLDSDAHAARADLEATAADHQAAVQVQAELIAARREWDAVTTTVAIVASGRAELERRRQDLAGKRDRLTDSRERLALVEQHLVEWQDLQRALGKRGLQELEIDAAGPTITARTNELLAHSIGPRYTVELVTQVATADGTAMRDDFTVRVIDNEAPGAGWRDIRAFSGGQKTILQEALMCAIALYVNERSLMPIRTLFRDETGSALDPVNAIRYVTMLRRVRELGHLHHIFFISHDPAAAALADAQIQIADGAARLVFPPYQEAAA
jgi:exonuclease SbcC